MDRRRFLTAVGATVGAGLVLGACGPLGRSGVPDGEPTLILRNPSYELVAGNERRYAFLLTDAENRALDVDEVELWVGDEQEEIVAGPFPATYHEEGEETFGTFRGFVDVPDPGIAFLYAVAGRDHGRAAIEVVAAEDSVLPAPGSPAIPSATPTTADDFGWAELCTRDPDCGMHEVSLADALAEGRPVFLAFATPAYCQTTVCAPAVDVAEAVRTSGEDWGDVAFIHVEIYSDEASTVTAPVTEWGLPTEPWYYAIDREGTIVERADGPLIAEDVAELVRLVR